MDSTQLKYIVEAALLAVGKPLNLDKLQSLFSAKEPPARQDIRAAIMELQAEYADRGLEVVEVGSGFRIQIRTSMTHQLEKLWEERPPRYSRALLETMSIIAYRQPVTRGEIEDIRGVAVSTNIVRTLLERNWIKVVGHRDVPGKPAMFGTTREFLDYFGLKKLDDLPPLSELKDFENLNVQLDFPEGEIPPVASAESNDDDESDASQEQAAEFAPEDPAEGVQEMAETDNVASLDAARAAAQTDGGDAGDVAEAPLEAENESATVLPLKQP